MAPSGQIPQRPYLVRAMHAWRDNMWRLGNQVFVIASAFAGLSTPALAQEEGASAADDDAIIVTAAPPSSSTAASSTPASRWRLPWSSATRRRW